MSSRVYVGRLSNEAREKDVEKFFSEFGKLKEVLMKNGYCFVEFDQSRDAEDAISGLDGKSLCGERVIVQAARGKRSQDDRGGRGNRDFRGGRDDRRDDRNGGRDRRPYRSRSPRDRNPRRRSASGSPPRKHKESRSASPVQKHDRKGSNEAVDKKPHSPSGSPGSPRSE